MSTRTRTILLYVLVSFPGLGALAYGLDGMMTASRREKVQREYHDAKEELEDATGELEWLWSWESEISESERLWRTDPETTEETGWWRFCSIPMRPENAVEPRSLFGVPGYDGVRMLLCSPEEQFLPDSDRWKNQRSSVFKFVDSARKREKDAHARFKDATWKWNQLNSGFTLNEISAWRPFLYIGGTWSLLVALCFVISTLGIHTRKMGSCIVDVSVNTAKHVPNSYLTGPRSQY